MARKKTKGPVSRVCITKDGKTKCRTLRGMSARMVMNRVLTAHGFIRGDFPQVLGTKMMVKVVLRGK